MRNTILLCLLSAALAAGGALAAGSPSGAVHGRVLVNPLSVVVLVPAGPQKAGKDFVIRAKVTNSGVTPLTNVAVMLLVPPGLVLREQPTQLQPRIGPGRTGTVSWNACAPDGGNYIAMARATVGPYTVESAAQLVIVTSVRRAKC